MVTDANHRSPQPKHREAAVTAKDIGTSHRRNGVPTRTNLMAQQHTGADQPSGPHPDRAWTRKESP